MAKILEFPNKKQEAEPKKLHVKLTGTVDGQEVDLEQWVKSLPPGGKFQILKDGKEI